MQNESELKYKISKNREILVLQNIKSQNWCVAKILCNKVQKNNFNNVQNFLW